MKNVATASWLVVALLAGAAPRATQAAQDRKQGGTAEAQIRQLEDQLTEATLRADASVYDRVFADDYTTTAMASGTRTKAKLIADAKSGMATTESLKLEDVKVRFYGDTAILTARRTQKSHYYGRDTSGAYYQIRVFVKQQGQWRAVALQTTPVPKA